MSPTLLAAAGAAWLGILTAISPCPLATNIAAVSYIGRRLGSPRQMFLSGILYAAGRTAAYVGLAAVLVSTALSVPRVSVLLQRHMNRLLGPIFILVGMVLVGLIELPTSGRGMGEGMQGRVDRLGLWGAGLLGVVFALSFCPLSAALYFGGLLPLSVEHQSRVLLPAVYGLGTALPVIGFAALLAMGTRAVGVAFQRLSQFEWWARRVTGVLFIGLGVFFCLHYIFGVFG
ncbi:MAG: aromatic aminobenezylarsenical efflux permease ArsG family transporter [Candidatus Brocadiia bacterium]